MTIRQNGQILAGAITGPYKANIDMDNLTDVGKNIGNWSSNVTNCITEIPQDIKLELNNGTLTLKAGSKVYVPNGFEQDGTTPKFDVITIENDLSISSGTSWAIGQYLFYYNLDTHILDQSAIINTTSGSSAPSSLGEAAWYNTTENKIRRYNSQGTSYNQISLPFCLCSNSTGNLFESIDQVFNGFGYIGSTVFALPGVKGLIPNGRNADGSLKSRSVTTQSVLTSTMAITGVVGFRENAVGSSNKYIYDEENNQNLNDGVYWNVVACGNVQMNNGKITTLTVKTTFHAADYNDLNVKANTDLSNLTNAGLAKLGPTVYVARGFLLNSLADTCEGHGIATVYLYPNGIAEVHFNIKITTTGTSSSNFNCGINRDLLKNINPNIPTITPAGGGSLTYYATNGTIADDKMEYGGAFTPAGQFWMPARVYSTSGEIGGWPASGLVAGQRLIGVCYGTYTI